VRGRGTWPQPRRRGQPSPKRLLPKDGSGTLLSVCCRVQISYGTGGGKRKMACQDVPPPFVSLPFLRWPQRSRNSIRRDGLIVCTSLADGFLQIRLCLRNSPTQQPRHSSRSEQFRGRQRRIRQLLGVEGVGVRVSLFPSDKVDGGFNQLE